MLDAERGEREGIALFLVVVVCNRMKGCVAIYYYPYYERVCFQYITICILLYCEIYKLFVVFIAAIIYFNCFFFVFILLP